MDDGALAAGVIVWLALVGLLGWAGSTIMKNKGRSPGAGFALGAFLGIIGIIIAAVLPAQGRGPGTSGGAVRECPACKELMRRDASMCPHCRTPSDPWTFSNGYWWVQRGESWYYLDERKQEWVRSEPSPSEAPPPPPA